MKVTLVRCFHCGNSFERPTKKVREAEKNGWRQFCCRECQSATKNRRRDTICRNCGKEIVISLAEERKSLSGNFFCSKSCAATFNNKGRVVSESQRQKVSESVRRSIIARFGLRPKNKSESERTRLKKTTPEKECPTCGKKFRTKSDTCSRD